MADLIDQLTALSPKIEQLMEIGGAAGLSLGVLHHGEPVYQANFGWERCSKLPSPDRRDDPSPLRTGMAWGDNLYIGTDNDILISGENSMRYINSQAQLLPFRGQFAYNNIPYELAGHVIDKLTALTWSEVLKSRILDPIGLEITSFETPPPDVDNVAKCYNTLDDGTPTPIRCLTSGDDGFLGASSGLRTCVKGSS